MCACGALSFIRLIVLGGLLAGLAGCSVAKIVHADGSEETRFLAIFPDGSGPIDTPRSIQITTLGFSGNSGRFDVGLRMEDIIVAPPKCHAVMIVRSQAELEAASKLLGPANDSCVMGR